MQNKRLLSFSGCRCCVNVKTVNVSNMSALNVCIYDCCVQALQLFFNLVNGVNLLPTVEIS